jgi:hypothetical protein
VKQAQVEVYCDACDKSFPSEKAYASHVATHSKCTHPGCSFEGTKKVVSVHYDTSHGTFSGTGYKDIEVEGQSFRVLMGTDSAEVEEWRNQRRKKFPTAAAVREKAASRKRLHDAGGICTEGSGKDRGKKRIRVTSEQSVGQSTGGVVASADAGGPGAAMSESSTPIAPSLCDGSGLSLLLNYDSDTEESGYIGEVSVPEGGDAAVSQQEQKPQRSGPSACRMFLVGKCKRGDGCRYSHDASAATAGDATVCSYFAKGKCRKGSKCVFSHDTNGVSKDSSSLAAGDRAAGRTKKKGGLEVPPPLDSMGPRGSLFRKLVEEEVDVEENIVLQCLRFIVSNRDAFWGEVAGDDDGDGDGDGDGACKTTTKDENEDEEDEQSSDSDRNISSKGDTN